MANEEMPSEQYKHLLPQLVTAEFPYHKPLKSIWRKQHGFDKTKELEPYEYYDLIDDEKNVVFSLVVSEVLRDSKESIVLTKKNEDRSALLFPFDQVTYTRNSYELRALVFVPFQTLSEYSMGLSVHVGVPIPITDELKFKTMSSGFISSLVHLENNNQVPWVINEHNLVLRDGVGTLLLLCLSPQSSNDKFDWNDAFKSLANIIRAHFNLANSNARFVSLLECMDTTTSIYNRRRLLRAPYYLSARQIVAEFAPLYFRVATMHSGFEKNLRSKILGGTINWLLGGYYKELDEVLRYNKYGNHRYELLRACRNIHEHLDEEWCNLHGYRVPILSVITEDYGILLTLIEQVDPNFAAEVFKFSYGISLDYIPLLDKE